MDPEKNSTIIQLADVKKNNKIAKFNSFNDEVTQIIDNEFRDYLEANGFSNIPFIPVDINKNKLFNISTDIEFEVTNSDTTVYKKVKFLKNILINDLVPLLRIDYKSCERPISLKIFQNIKSKDPSINISDYSIGHILEAFLFIEDSINKISNIEVNSINKALIIRLFYSSYSPLLVILLDRHKINKKLYSRVTNLNTSISKESDLNVKKINDEDIISLKTDAYLENIIDIISGNASNKIAIIDKEIKKYIKSIGTILNPFEDVSKLKIVIPNTKYVFYPLKSDLDAIMIFYPQVLDIIVESYNNKILNTNDIKIYLDKFKKINILVSYLDTKNLDDSIKYLENCVIKDKADIGNSDIEDFAKLIGAEPFSFTNDN